MLVTVEHDIHAVWDYACGILNPAIDRALKEAGGIVEPSAEFPEIVEVSGLSEQQVRDVVRQHGCSEYLGLS